MKKVIISVLSLFLILFLSLFISGKTYLLKAFKATYLQGHSTAHISDKSSFDLATVAKGNSEEWKLSSTYNQKELSNKFETFNQDNKSIAMLMIKDGQLDFEKYWDGGEVNSSTNSFSMSKSIVGMLLGIAMKEDKIQNVFQPISDFIPEFAEMDQEKYFNHKLEIRHLLSMTAGLEWTEDYYSISQTSEAYYGSDIKKQMLDLKVVVEPGTEFKYQSASSQLLAMVVEKATGMTLAEYASEKLWKPLGATQDASWHTDDNGNAIAFCCFNSNARDFARLGQLFLNKGDWNGTQLIPEPFIDISTQANAKADNYGYQWWIYNSGNVKAHYMHGHLGQYVVVIPELNIVFVRLGKKESKSEDNIKTYIDEMVRLYK